MTVANQDFWISPPHDGGRYTASAGAWSVDSGDENGYMYRMVDTTLFLNFSLANTSLSLAAATLKITIPEGRAAVSVITSYCTGRDNGTTVDLLARSSVSGSTIDITKADGTNFAASTNATDVYGEIVVELTA